MGWKHVECSDCHMIIISREEDGLCYKCRENKRLKNVIELYENALRLIDVHIRSTPEPVPQIIKTLMRTLPEYQEVKND